MALRGCRIWGDAGFGGDHLGSVLALCNGRKTPPCAPTWRRGEQWAWRDISSWIRPQSLSVPATNVSKPQNLKGSGRWLGAAGSGSRLGTGICGSGYPGYVPDYTTGPVLGYWGCTGAHWGELDPDGNNWDHCGVMWGTVTNQGYTLGSERGHFGPRRCNLGPNGAFLVLS